MTFTLLGNRVAIEIIKPAEKVTKAGIILPAGIYPETTRGIIKALGTDILNKTENLLKVGQVIICPEVEKYVNQEIEDNGTILTVIDEEDIVAIIDELDLEEIIENDQIFKLNKEA